MCLPLRMSVVPPISTLKATFLISIEVRLLGQTPGSQQPESAIDIPKGEGWLCMGESL